MGFLLWWHFLFCCKCLGNIILPLYLSQLLPIPVKSHLSHSLLRQPRISNHHTDILPAKTKKTYLTQGRNSSLWTAVLILTCIYLSISETVRWFTGTTMQTFSVEKSVSHDLQINLDIVVAMRCADLHVNIQDAAGDRTLAGEMLRMDPTSWGQWGRGGGIHKLGEGEDGLPGWEELWDVHDQLGAAKKRKKFPKTPRVRGLVDSCRIFGSVEGNKVQGDFHITARGHGYQAFGDHLDHSGEFKIILSLSR